MAATSCRGPCHVAEPSEPTGGYDGCLDMSRATSLSARSSEPSAVARNKIAELQLRVELERVLRLQKETELEQQRREHLLTASKSGGAGAK